MGVDGLSPEYFPLLLFARVGKSLGRELVLLVALVGFEKRHGGEGQRIIIKVILSGK